MKSEKAIQNEILMAVTAEPNCMFWRETSAKAWVGRVVSRDGSRVTLDQAMPIVAGCEGIPDIMGVAHGRSVGIEVKTDVGRQEPSQVRFQRVYEAKGGTYGIARSVDEALAFLRRSVLS